MRHFQDHMIEKPLGDMRPGGVLLFRDKAYPCHAAIVGERGGALTMIHAYALQRKVVENRLDHSDWMSRRVAYFEFEGVEYE